MYEVSLAFNIFSRILPGMGTIEIGLISFNNFEFPFLGIGVVILIFHLFGKIPVVKHLLIMWRTTRGVAKKKKV